MPDLTIELQLSYSRQRAGALCSQRLNGRCLGGKDGDEENHAGRELDQGRARFSEMPNEMRVKSISGRERLEASRDWISLWSGLPRRENRPRPHQNFV